MEQMKNNENLQWGKKKKLSMDGLVKPIVNNLLLLIEEEKKRTLKQIEDVKILLDKVNNK